MKTQENHLVHDNNKVLLYSQLGIKTESVVNNG